MEIDAAEVLQVLRELFPREVDIAALTVVNRRLMQELADLQGPLRSEPFQSEPPPGV